MITDEQVRVALPELPNGWWPKKQGKQYFDAEQMRGYAEEAIKSFVASLGAEPVARVSCVSPNGLTWTDHGQRRKFNHELAEIEQATGRQLGDHVNCIHSAVAPNMNHCIKCGRVWDGQSWNTRHQPSGGAGAEGWSGWATQYPGKLPKLYGDRAIAQLNHHPDEGQRLLFLTTGAEDARDGALRPAQKALRRIRNIADERGTQVQHGNAYVQGMRKAANILDEAINRAAMSDQNKGEA